MLISHRIDSISYPKYSTDQFLDLKPPGDGLPLIFSILWDPVDPAQWIDRLNKLLARYRMQYPTCKIIVIFNSWYKGKMSALDSKGYDDILYFDLCLGLLYQRILVDRECDFVTDWTCGYNQFLFLTGKPEKIHRLGLLYRFWQHGLLARCVYSLYDTGHLWENIDQILPDIPEQIAREFVSNHARSPDHFSPFMPGDQPWFGSGIPYALDLRQRCDFEVVSETEFDDVCWITEKTYLALLNHRPFIMAGTPGILQLLQKWGFKTFGQYLKIPEYDQLPTQDRLTAIVINSETWLETIVSQRDQIIQDVRYNHRHLIELINKEVSKANDFIQKHQLQCTVNQLLGLWDPNINSAWYHFYYRVKDPSWPDCYQERFFDQLPVHVKQECIEVFGYRPKYP